MAQLLKNILGGDKAASAVPSGDSDFADFPGVSEATKATAASLAGSTATGTAVPYTKWYNVHERYSMSDFRVEGVIFSIMAVVLIIHIVGTRLNRNKARAWVAAHQKLLAAEFALAGFGRVPPALADEPEAAALQAMSDKISTADPWTLLKENSLFEYSAYVTGRQNVAFADIKLKLIKRFNPFMLAAEYLISFFVESMPAPEDTLEAILYPFDGKETLTAPGLVAANAAAATASSSATASASIPKSTYDSFVWAIVNKERMKLVRDERFDVSITFTKDNAKLPPWLTVMSESAEITEALLTPELVKAAEAAGEALDYLIVTDQPLLRPTTINETNPRKRVYLKYHIPSNNNYDALLPIFAYFCRSADVLVQSAHLRPEVLRKVKAAREAIVRQIVKAEEEEKAEERALEREKARKMKRDAELNALDAKAQKKYLEREREKEIRRSSKRSTMRA